MAPDWDDDGLPDAAFTEAELAAGAQHIMRTGNPNATSSGYALMPRPSPLADDCGSDNEENVLLSRDADTLFFSSFAQARAWGQANPGRAFSRAANGQGYEAKLARTNDSVNKTSRNYDSLHEIKDLAPHLHFVLANSRSNGRRDYIPTFYRNTWLVELSQLSNSQLMRLRTLVADELESARRFSRDLHELMRMDRRMKPGNYLERLREKLIELKARALADIDNRLTAGRN